jgi:hypothetical protein
MSDLKILPELKSRVWVKFTPKPKKRLGDGLNLMVYNCALFVFSAGC